MRLLTTAPTNRAAVTRAEMQRYMQHVMQAEPLSRRAPQPSPLKITEWVLFRAWVDSKVVARRIRHERLLAQAETASSVRSRVLLAPWRQ